MTFSKKAVVGTASAVATLAGLVVGAASWTVGTVDVAPWGGSGTTPQSNLKVSNSNEASFNGDVIPNALGYSARIVNSGGSSRSNSVGLYKDRTTYASGNSGQVNYYYYAQVSSSGVEPNWSTVKLHFSADKK